jgi:hypothetical protein
MKYVLTILSLLILNTAISQPVAHAGADQTIYLTSINSVTLNGTSSTGTGLSYQWREVSTDYSSGATITNANTATATVSPLPQGVFYFELQVTDNVDRTSVDTVKITVNYATAPGTLLRSMAQTAWHNTEFIDTLNDRSGDTVNTLDQEVYHTISFPDGLGNEIFFDRNRKPDEWIDAQRGKFYSRVEDGYDWNNQGYGRAEMSFGTGYSFDTTKIYCMEWKGYFPQAFPSDMTVNQTVATFMQIHANSDAQHVFGTQIVNTGSEVNFVLDADGSLHTLCGVDSFVNKTHTVRVTFKEGTPGAFYKVEVDGVQKYYNSTSVIGGLPRGQDYPKIATLYDYGNALVDPTNSTRGRTFSMVTEDFSIYEMSSSPAPTISMSGSQVINTTSTSVTAVGTPASGESITSYSWTKLSGTGAITSPSSSTTGLTGLAGTSTYQCTVTQTDGQTASGTVTVTVNVAPTANAGIDQTITLPTNSVTLSGSGTDTDGTISSYSWTKISGGTATITSPTSASTTITGLVAGTYVFQLQVTDNNGATATDTVQITVNAASITNYFITHGKTIYINK